ncbi:MAG: PHP domain-containing protein, partial [Candidatus Nanohaloarchaea archaeon]
MKDADLHTHSTASDGTDSVYTVVETARERDIDCVAITDHDTLHEELDFRVEQRGDVELINGAEIKAEIDGTKIEILSYFLDTSDPGLKELTERIEELRVERMQEMVERVNQVIEPELTMDDVEKEADGTLARPHLAKALKRKGLVDTVSEAFEKFIGNNCEGYVPTKKLPAEEVIERVHENGGVTSLAHPGRDLKGDEDEKVGKLADMGLDAIEVPYSYDRLESEHSIPIHFKEARARELAEKHDLLVSGGSDSHGTESQKDYIGNVRLDYEKVEKLKQKARL